MKDLLTRQHKHIYDNFDLGSTTTILITIYQDRAIITNSNLRVWGKEISVTEIGKYIAETILLTGLEVTGIEYDDWLRNKELKPLEYIMDLTENDVYFNTELVKLWTLARTISNMEREKDRVYEIYYDKDCDIVTCDECTIEGYRQMINYIFDKKEEMEF